LNILFKVNAHTHVIECIDEDRPVILLYWYYFINIYKYLFEKTDGELKPK